MPDYEARVKTKFGEFIIHFSNKADLEKKLSQIPELTATIERAIGSTLAKEPEKVIQGLESIYTFGSDGLVKLLKYPKKKSELVRLALFLSPIPLTPVQLKSITGEHNPAAYMTTKDFIENPDGTYTLSSDARAEVVGKTIPFLKAQKEMT